MNPIIPPRHVVAARLCSKIHEQAPPTAIKRDENHVQDIVMLCKFVYHYWQGPILIKCVNCYYLCVLRWLMRPILALNCLLQIAQEKSEEESSVGDASALAFRCARFCLASLILFDSYSPAPLLCWYVKVFKVSFEGVLVSLLQTTYL